MSRIYKNIKREYLFQLVKSSSLSEAVWMLFLTARGMNLIQIGLLESIFHITGMLMEVPTGFIADRYGRKTSRIIACAMAMASSIVLLGSRGFWGFALGFVLSSLSFNLESGAGDALVYDSLKECGKEQAFMKVKGRSNLCYQLAHILALALGGTLAQISYELVYGLTAVIHLSALIIALGFEEPRVAQRNKELSLFQHMGESMRAIWKYRLILPFMLHLEVFSLFYNTVYFYFQTFMKGSGYQEYQIGIILALASALGGLFSVLAYKVEGLLGEKGMILLTGLLPGILFVALSIARVEPYVLMLISGLEGLMFVVLGDYIHKRIPSEHRALLLSFESMLFSTMMIVFFPIIGGVSQYFGFKRAFALIGGLSLVSGSITAAILLRTLNKETQNVDAQKHEAIEA
jgi:MFS family permease